MIFDTQPTPLDLRFRLFGIPVRVLPWFWLIMALLGDTTLKLGVSYLLMWVICGFVSILVHELGHALFYRWFGSWSEILLIAFGGLAVADRVPAQRWKRIAISLAGPGFGFALCGLVFVTEIALEMNLVKLPRLAGAALGFLFVQCLFWNTFNLLPIWPLDGAKVCRELCGASRARNPDAIAFGISFFTAAGLAVIGALDYLRALPPQIEEWMPFRFGPFMTLWMVLFAFESYQLWQQALGAGRWNRHDDDDTPPWRQ